MGRLIAFVLGGLALALYLPHLFLGDVDLAKYQQWWIDKIGDAWHVKLFAYGPGIFAGCALILLAIRGREGGGGGHM
jgi:hypothetical protein